MPSRRRLAVQCLNVSGQAAGCHYNIAVRFEDIKMRQLLLPLLITLPITAFADDVVLEDGVA
jgi:hypothetical protein